MPDNINKSPSSIILVVIMLFGLLLAGAGFYLLQKEKAHSTDLEQELEGVKIKLNVSERKFEEAKNKSSELEAKLTESEANVALLTGKLKDEQGAKVEALGQIEKIKAELGEQKDLRSGLEGKLNQADEDMGKIQAQLKDLKAQKKDLEDKLKELQARVGQQAQNQNVELGTIEVNPQAGIAPRLKENRVADSTGPAEGKVLVVNKDYNFAVLNLGAKDGIQPGDIFSIYHNNKDIGQVKVEKVHDSMSAADFVSGNTKEQIAEGDRAVEKTK